jgi:hypothetical protein
MKQYIFRTAIIIGIIPLLLFAKPPVRYMYQTTIGGEYYAAMRGQLITNASVPSHERIQLIYFTYAPVEYVQFAIGFGADRFSTDHFNDRRFDGRYGFSPALSLSGNSPLFLMKILRVTLNIDFLYLNSTDKFKFKYSGAILDPSLGLLAYAGKFVDLELGARGHLIGGTMTDKTETVFSNAEIIRGYLAVTLASRKGAYLQLHLDASPRVTMEFNKGPSEAAMGFSIGALITPDRTNRKLQEKTNKYFPAFNDMKKKEDDMADQIE